MKHAKYATFHLLMKQVDKYFIGACISGYSYKKYTNNTIDNNIMVDENVTEEQKKKLQKYFDNVFPVPLLAYNSNFPVETKKMKERYGSWIQFATTKWMSLCFDQYEKILFCDIDTLAMDDYTNIFSVKTPAWTCHHKSYMDNKKLSTIISTATTGKEMTKEFIKTISSNTLQDICSYKTKNKYFPLPVNASMVLLSPSKDTFTNLFSYINKNRFIRMLSYMNGPDENILFQYFVCHRKQKVYHLGLEYLTTEWRYKKKQIAYKNVKKPIIMNYDSTDKPWIKVMYEEEKIWDTLKKEMKL